MTLTRKTSGLAKTIVPLGAAAIALAVSTVMPLLGPLVVALVIGAVLANSRWVAHTLVVDHEKTTKTLLRLGVVLLGLRLPLGEAMSIGARGALIIIVTVVATFSLTSWVGGRLRLDPRFVTLMAAGFAICGAAAIAAINDVVKARQRDVALAVALVTIFGSAMIVVLPWAARLLELSDVQASIWAGASIHEVAQVLATASVLGPGSIALATTIKLGRVVLLGPTLIVAARGVSEQSSRVPIVPWFVAGFVAMIVLRTIGLLPTAALGPINVVTTVLLAGGMFGLGLGLRIGDLLPLPTRAVVLALYSTTVAAVTSLILIESMY